MVIKYLKYRPPPLTWPDLKVMVIKYLKYLLPPLTWPDLKGKVST